MVLGQVPWSPPLYHIASLRQKRGIYFPPIKSREAVQVCVDSCFHRSLKLNLGVKIAQSKGAGFFVIMENKQSS